MADKKNPTKKAVELSKEELAVKRNEITEYYNDHIPHLKAQYEYENLHHQHHQHLQLLLQVQT